MNLGDDGMVEDPDDVKWNRHDRRVDWPCHHGCYGALTQRLLDEYGASELELACVEAMERGVPHDNAVRQSLERRRELQKLPPALALVLPDNEKVRNLTVRKRNLAAYDQINKTQPTTTHTEQETPSYDTTTDNDNTGS